MGGNHDFSAKLFCLAGLKTFVGEPLVAVLEKNSGSKEVYGQDTGEISRFSVSVENYLWRSAEKFQRGVL